MSPQPPTPPIRAWLISHPGASLAIAYELADGTTLSARCEHPLGAFENPLSRAQIEQKFRTYAQGFLPDAHIADVIGAAAMIVSEAALGTLQERLG